MSNSQDLNFNEKRYKPKDKFGNKMATENKPLKGRVKIYERNIEGSDKKLYVVENNPEYKKIHDTSNLIVYRGRHWLLQRAFNLDLAEDPDTGSYTNTDRQDWKDKFISWFAVGTGGAASETPLNPIAVSPGSYELNTHGSVSGTVGRYMTVGGREYHVFESGYPTLHSDLEIETDDYADLDNTYTFDDPLLDSSENPRKDDSFLIAKIQVRLNADEGNGAGTQNINEAGLYVCQTKDPSDAAGLTSDDIQLFAKVSFETTPKHSAKELVFSWYIYF